MSTADRCKETTTTTGTGNITLLGAVSQFQAFSDVFTPPATVSYAIVGQSGTEWEVGVGTLSASSTLERTTVQASSNAGAAVNFSAGTKDVFATITAQDMADITTALAGKASTSHTHAISDTTGLQTALDGKAASSHTHAISDTTGLQTALDGKAATSHSHAAGDITSGTIATARLGSGTADNTTFLRGDNTWATPSGGSTDASSLTSGTLDDARLSSNVALENVANTFTAAQTISTNGAASTPAVSITGTVFTGGTATTTKPQLLIEPAGTTSTNWSTSGTLLGLNSANGFSGNVIDVQTNNSSRFKIASSGLATFSGFVNSTTYRVTTNTGVLTFGTSNDTGLGRDSAGVLEANNGTQGTLRDIKARNFISDNTVQLKGYTVAQLNALTGLTEGMTAYCTDATAPTYLGTLTGGGAVKCPVFYNGSAWVSH